MLFGIEKGAAPFGDPGRFSSLNPVGAEFEDRLPAIPFFRQLPHEHASVALLLESIGRFREPDQQSAIDHFAVKGSATGYTDRLANVLWQNNATGFIHNYGPLHTTISPSVWAIINSKRVI
jgi:hypothetical protein